MRATIDRLRQDVRYGVRLIRRTPGSSIGVIVTLALAIGPATSIVTLVQSVLLRPLPLPNPEQLVLITAANRERQRDDASYPELRDWQHQNQTLAALAGFVGQNVGLTGAGEPEQVRAGFVSSSFFDVVATPPRIGRSFTAAEGEPGGVRLAVLNHGFWQRKFGGDPAVLGRTISVNGLPFEVVGVMAAGFEFPLDPIDVWLPLPHYGQFSDDRRVLTVMGVGRLRAAIDRDLAQTDMNVIAQRLARDYPATNTDRGIMVTPLHDVVVERARPLLLVLLSAVGFVLALACANVVNLLLARGFDRQRELALRVALGATSGRTVSQLLTEGLLLSVMGGGLGLLVAPATTSVLLDLGIGKLPEHAYVGLDGRMLLVALGLMVVTSVAVGLTPALQMRVDPSALLKAGGRNVSGNRRFRAVRTMLAALQIAAALTLVIGAGVMLQTLVALRRADPGFDPTNLTTMEYRLPRARYETGSQQLAFHAAVMERVRALPGVAGVALVRSLPFSGNVAAASFLAESNPAPGLEPQALLNTVSTDYFTVMRVPLVRGRVFSTFDRADSLPVAVVSRSLAERSWPGRDPIGRTVRLPEYSLALQVVGVVADVKHGQLQEAATAQIYTPYAQRPDIFATLVVRTESEPSALGATIRNAIWSVDPDQPVWKIRTMTALLSDSTASRRTLMWLLGLFGTAALGLAGLGTYAVVSQSMRARRREMGIRHALGAQTADILRIVLQQAARLSAAGVSLGMVGSLWLTSLMSHLVAGAAPAGGWTFVAATGIISAVVLGACVLPARHAITVNPIVVLRSDD